MKTTSLRILSLALLVALLAAILPSPVYAATVLTVTPSTAYNNVVTTITVGGTGFDNSAVVLLEGSALATTFLNDQTLTAVVPAGLTAGSYTLEVSMTGGVTTGSVELNIADLVVPPPFARPQFAIYTSRLVGKAQTNGEVTLKIIMENVGESIAYNTQATFTSSDLVPTKTGGIAVVGKVLYDQEVEVSQAFYVSAQIYGQGVIVVDMTLIYYDEIGTAYSDKFTLSIPVSGVAAVGGSVAATSTPTGVKSSQLVITSYSASVDPLQPGEQFALTMTIQNVGNDKAQRVTMIVGGGSSGMSGGTPEPGGVSGGGGDFANFAPVGASNVQSLGDVPAGGSVQAAQNLIVNVSTNPGAYPMKISFSYLNNKNEVINDEQVITLLVYSLPNVDVSFYRPLDPFYVGQPGALPIQVVNLGRRLSVLGNIKVSVENGLIENGTSLVGSLEPGGYFTVDSMLTPDQPGPLELTFTIEYTDDFNQARTITRTLNVEVMESFEEPLVDPSTN